MEQIKLLGMTAVVTVLIWASADSLVSETVTISVTFDVIPALADSTMLIEVDRPVDVQVSGPRRVIKDLQAQPPRRIRLPIADRPTGQALIPLDKQTLKRRMAERWREFRKLSIVSVHPTALPVTVDHRIAHEVDIVLKRRTLQYGDEPHISPNRAVVRMRDSVFEELAPAGQLAPIDITGEVERQLGGRIAGQKTTVSVVLDLSPFGRDAEIVPSAIEVTATVSTQRSTEEIPTVPILLAVSFANLGKAFTAVPRDGNVPVTRTIKVTGPAADVQRLLRGETRAFGLIRLMEDDLQPWSDFRPLTPEYHLPRGIELAEEPGSIEFRLIPASSTLTQN